MSELVIKLLRRSGVIGEIDKSEIEKYLGRLWRLKVLIKPIYIGEYEKEGWRNKLPFYLFRCSKHGYGVDYLHGYDEYLYCPQCLEERLKTIGGD